MLACLIANANRGPRTAAFSLEDFMPMTAAEKQAKRAKLPNFSEYLAARKRNLARKLAASSPASPPQAPCPPCPDPAQ